MVWNGSKRLKMTPSESPPHTFSTLFFDGFPKGPLFIFCVPGLVAYQSSRTSKENIGETRKGFLHGGEINQFPREIHEQ